MAGGQWMGRGTVLRHPAVTPMLTLTLSLSLTCTRAPLALTQPCGSAEETPLWQRKRRGSDSGWGGARTVSPAGTGHPGSLPSPNTLLSPPWPVTDASHPAQGVLGDTSAERSARSRGVSCHYGNLGGGSFPRLSPTVRSRRDVPARCDDSLLFLPASPRGSCSSQQCRDPPGPPTWLGMSGAWGRA